MSPERLAEIEARLDSVPTCPLYRAKNGGKAHPKGTQVWMNDRGDGRFVADSNCNHGDYAAVFANAVADLTDLLAEVRRLTAALAWQDERHGPRAEQEAEEATAEAEWAEIQAMSEEEVTESLRASGLNVEESQARTAALVRVCAQRGVLAAEVDRLTVENGALRARLRDTCQRLVEAVGADGPCDAEQAADRVVARLAETERDREKLIRKIDCVARERDDLGRLTDRLRERLMTLDRERNRALAQLSAYTDLPPEPDTALGAFMAVLEVDNDPEEPDNDAGDCDGESP